MMVFGRARKGDVVNVETPDWTPLLNVVPEAVAEFAWMCEIALRDGTRIHVYANEYTGRSVHLTADREAWTCVGEGLYKRTYLYQVVMRALRPWWHHAGAFTEAELDYHRALDNLLMERLTD